MFLSYGSVERWHEGRCTHEMDRAEAAVSKFMEGYNCAQAVLYSFCDVLGFDQDAALKLACGFGAGMGRKEEVCGAVAGGIMALSLRYGRGEKQDSTRTDQTYRKVRELMDGFAERHGTYICRRLLDGCELTTPEGQSEFKEKDLKDKVCRQCVGDVVEILEDILD